MNKHLKYLSYVLRHKWFVFLACLQIGGIRLLWRGIIHDWSKFLPSEWSPYVEYFNGEKVQAPNNANVWDEATWTFVPKMVSPQHVRDAFDVAWNHHQKRNDHHWQYWLLNRDIPNPNFNLQSHDGGMSEAFIGNKKGQLAALVMYHSVDWLKVSRELEQQLLRDLRSAPTPLPMSPICRMEMLADWIGAGKALGKPLTWEWYEQQKQGMNIFLHPDTAAWVEGELDRMKYQYESDMRRPKSAKFGLFWFVPDGIQRDGWRFTINWRMRIYGAFQLGRVERNGGVLFQTVEIPRTAIHLVRLQGNVIKFIFAPFIWVGIVTLVFHSGNDWHASIGGTSHVV